MNSPLAMSCSAIRLMSTPHGAEQPSSQTKPSHQSAKSLGKAAKLIWSSSGEPSQWPGSVPSAPPIWAASSPSREGLSKPRNLKCPVSSIVCIAIGIANYADRTRCAQGSLTPRYKHRASPVRPERSRRAPAPAPFTPARRRLRTPTPTLPTLCSLRSHGGREKAAPRPPPPRFRPMHRMGRGTCRQAGGGEEGSGTPGQARGDGSSGASGPIACVRRPTASRPFQHTSCFSRIPQHSYPRDLQL